MLRFEFHFLQVVPVLLIAFSSYAKEPVGNQDIRISRSGTGHIYLAAKNCEILISQAAALEAWSVKLDERETPINSCICNSNECKIDVGNVSPQSLRELQGLKPKYMGPNCWNASLVTGKIVPELRFADPAEMTFWMDSPLCRELGPDETPAAGDIVAIRDRDGVEQHGFIYLTDKLAFSKNGYTNTAAYSLQSPEDVWFLNDVRAGCQRVTGNKFPPQCPNYANFYDCESLNRYMSERKIIPSDKLRQLSYDVCKAEIKLSDVTLFGKVRNSDASNGESFSDVKNSLNQTLSVLTQYAVTEVKEPHPADEDFLWKSLIVRLDSTKTQLKDIQ